MLKTLPIIYMLVCRIILYPSSPWTLWTSVTGIGAEFSTRRLDFLFFVLAAWIWMESDFSLMFRGRLLLCVRLELKDNSGSGSWKMTSSCSSSLRCWWFTWWPSSVSSLFLPLRLLGAGNSLSPLFLPWKTLLLRPFFFRFLNLIFPLTTNFPAKNDFGISQS